jgi:hypothetical protein
MADRLEFVTYCGLHCDLCAARSRIPRRAAALQQAMADEGWNYWGQNVPGFAAFWKFLAELQAGGGCPGCRAGGGFPGCQIRVCARERGVALCARCPDFPCEHVGWLAARYPTLIADNRRLQAVGLDRWLEEQAERVRRGVIYADTRYEGDEPAEE